MKNVFQRAMSRSTIVRLATVLALCSPPANSLICYECTDSSGSRRYFPTAPTPAPKADLSGVPAQCLPTTTTTTPEPTTTGDLCAKYYNQIYGSPSPPAAILGFCGFPFQEGIRTGMVHCGGACFTATEFESQTGTTSILRGCTDANVTTSCEREVHSVMFKPPIVTMTCISACRTDFCNSGINYADSHATRLRPAQSTLWLQLMIASAGVVTAAAASVF